MDYKIVFFDIDGTLVNEKKELPASTVDAIHMLMKKGIECVIATGRAPYFFRSIAEQLGIDSYVSLNGAHVVYKGQPIKKYAIPREDLALLHRHATSNQHPLVFQGEESYFTNDREHPNMQESIRSFQVELPRYNPDYWRENDVFQAFLHCPAEEEHLYDQAFPNLRLVRWHPYALDVMPSGGSKARGFWTCCIS